MWQYTITAKYTLVPYWFLLIVIDLIIKFRNSSYCISAIGLISEYKRTPHLYAHGLICKQFATFKSHQVGVQVYLSFKRTMTFATFHTVPVEENRMCKSDAFSPGSWYRFTIVSFVSKE